MDLTSPRTIKNLLKKYKVRPSKKFGQNFLISKSVLKKIIEAAKLKRKDIILEIGPGIGTLTQELAKRVKKVIAVEKDEKMIKILKEAVRSLKNIEIIKGDILKIENLKLEIGNFSKVVANLPYSIVSPTIRRFLELRGIQPQPMILMVQKEVAQRICAKPPKMNLLAVSVQFYSQPKIISFVSKKSFWPKPKVDSAIIKIILSSAVSEAHARAFYELFFRIVRAGFSQPRKQLINNLSQKLKIEKEKVKDWLLKNKIQPIQRAETLRIEDWLKLVKTFREIQKTV